MSAITEATSRARAVQARTSVAYRLARANADQLRSRLASEAKARAHALRRAARATRIKAEDAADATRLSVRRHPVRSLAIAFVAGSAMGLLGAVAYGKRNRSRAF